MSRPNRQAAIAHYLQATVRQYHVPVLRRAAARRATVRFLLCSLGSTPVTGQPTEEEHHG